MRKVILGVAVSLDGFIEGPNGEYDWCFTDQDYGMAEFFKSVDAVFIGRKSYELMQSMGEAGEIPGMPPMKEYIFSQTLSTVREGSELIAGDTMAAARAIKQTPGKDIWLFGGASLTTSLMNAGLVDECWLSIHPILLGSGKPMFSNIEKRISMKLLSSKAYSSGLVSVRYAVNTR